MSFLWYFLFPLLFLSFNVKKASLGEQIGRYLFGFIVTFMAFYGSNMDRSLSFLISSLKFIAIFQIIVGSISGISGNLINKKGNPNIKIAKNPLNIVYIVVLVGSIFYSAMPFIYGGAKQLYTLGNVKQSTEQSPKIDTENIIIIPPETAYYEMQTLVGSLPNPSLYKIGQISLTKTADGAYYVAPIDIEGDFKAFLNKELPGVAYVSAEKLEDATLINAPHKYGESLVFNHNIYRKLRAYKPNSILLNANIELDDSKNPYYIGSYGHYKYGRNGIVVDGVLVYSVKDGEIKDYSKNNAPKWVDQIYTTDIAEKYNEYFGKYKDGLINSLIGQKDVHVPTAWKSDTSLDGLNIESNQVVPVIGSNGELYYFTDHTNTSNTSTTMTGYTLMNTRTGQMTYYKTAGALNGLGAMNSVEKLLGADKANWTTSQPILYNIYGIDTWIVPVINKTDGSFVKLGLVTSQSKFGILAANKADLLEAFERAIEDGSVNANSDVKISNNAQLKETEKEGKLIRINQTIENGSSIFYLKLDSVPDKIFMVSKSVNADVVLARDGDPVKIKYIEMENQKIIPVTEFTLTIQ